MSKKPRFLSVDGTQIAYHHHEGSSPGVMFLGGFMSDMEGSKATMMDAYCRQQGWQFTRMDYGGHGQSSGVFADGTISLWRDHALAVLDSVAAGPQVLVGSSMGGWMMLLLALARPERVAGLVGIAAAPDFTGRLMWDAFSPAQKREMQDTGRVVIPNCMPGEAPYPITHGLIEDGRRNALLDKEAIAISCPVHLLHGMKDPDVPWELSLELARKLQRKDVEITLVKDGDHRMSQSQNLILLQQAVTSMVTRVTH